MQGQAVKVVEGGQTPLGLSALIDDVLCAQMYDYRADNTTSNCEGQTPAVVWIDTQEYWKHVNLRPVSCADSISGYQLGHLG